MSYSSRMPTPKKLLPSRQVQERYGVCNRTLYRWLRNPALDFPHATSINGRLYFNEAELIDWERTRAATALSFQGEDAS